MANNYYVIRDDVGRYLCIAGFTDARMHADQALGEWSTFGCAAQWYRSSPDRVHVFSPHGVFGYAWCVGLDMALALMGRYGGHLLFMNGETDLPFVPGETDLPPAPIHHPNRFTAWDWVMGDESPNPKSS